MSENHAITSPEATAAAVEALTPTVVVMNSQIVEQLREPFDPGQIGKRPKIFCRECRDARWKCCDQYGHTRRYCRECGNTMTSAHLHLDYVGHAQVTDRLNAVDPNWDWEPVAFTPEGLPRFDEQGGLWIRLTIAGKPRLGYGDAQGKRGPDAVKETIGDAIRNAAMRFGVGIQLWGAKIIDSADADVTPVSAPPADTTAAAAPVSPAPQPRPVDRPVSEPWDEPGGRVVGAGRPPADPSTRPEPDSRAETSEPAGKLFFTAVSAIRAATNGAELDAILARINQLAGGNEMTLAEAGKLRLKVGVRRDDLADEIPDKPAPVLATAAN